MKGKKSLDTIFKEKRETPPIPTASEGNGQVAVPKETKRPASRNGKRIVSGWFDVEVHKQLRLIAAEEDKTLEKVLGDAINALFTNLGKPPIA